MAALTGVQSSNPLFNPFAAVPSMHVAFALMLGLPMAALARRRWAKMLWATYPAVVTFVVVATEQPLVVRCLPRRGHRGRRGARRHAGV